MAPSAVGVGGVEVGHWTDAVAATGCTVVLLPEGTVGSGVVRGGAPATREFELLDPSRHVERIDAVVLSGGSAFGLASADGVMSVLAQRGTGFPTSAGPVPIVVAMALFDLGVGDGTVRPDAASGAAAVAAAAPTFDTGPVGAGTGATVGKWRGRDQARPGGLGVGTVTAAGCTVTAVVAVNAVGDRPDGLPPSERAAAVVQQWPPDEAAFENTTIGVVVTDAVLDAAGCRWVAEGAHDGLARALVPAHTRFDGDAFVVAATGETAGLEFPVDRVRVLAAAAVETAITSVL